MQTEMKPAYSNSFKRSEGSPISDHDWPQAVALWVKAQKEIAETNGWTLTRATQQSETGTWLFEAWHDDLWDPKRAGRIKRDITLAPPSFPE